MPVRPFEGEVAIVTGGGRGIGLVISNSLAEQGAFVCVTGRNEEHLISAVEEIRGKGGQAEYAVGDVSDKAAMEEAVGHFKDVAGPISVLVNNAGIGVGGPFVETDPDEWWRVMEVNVKGPMIMSRLVLPDMISANRGYIINMGSYVAISPSPMASSYGTSKAALLRLTDSISEEVRDHGVVVIAVSPGWVWTDMTREAARLMGAGTDNWDGIDPAYVFEETAVSDLIYQVVAGKADAFQGRLLHVKDDLDELLENSEELLEADKFALRFNM